MRWVEVKCPQLEEILILPWDPQVVHELPALLQLLSEVASSSLGTASFLVNYGSFWSGKKMIVRPENEQDIVKIPRQ